MRILLHKDCEKYLRRQPKKIRIAFANRIDLFCADPFADELHNHPLQGELSGCRSFSITGDIRAQYEEITKDTAFIFAIGTHHQLYGN